MCFIIFAVIYSTILSYRSIVMGFSSFRPLYKGKQPTKRHRRIIKHAGINVKEMSKKNKNMSIFCSVQSHIKDHVLLIISSHYFSKQYNNIISITAKTHSATQIIHYLGTHMYTLLYYT